MRDESDLLNFLKVHPPKIVCVQISFYHIHFLHCYNRQAVVFSCVFFMGANMYIDLLIFTNNAFMLLKKQFENL